MAYSSFVKNLNFNLKSHLFNSCYISMKWRTKRATAGKNCVNVNVNFYASQCFVLNFPQQIFRQIFIFTLKSQKKSFSSRETRQNIFLMFSVPCIIHSYFFLLRVLYKNLSQSFLALSFLFSVAASVKLLVSFFGSFWEFRFLYTNKVTKEKWRNFL